MPRIWQKNPSMKKLYQLLAEYGKGHQSPANKLIHWLCVLAIFFSVVALLWSIPKQGLVSLVKHPFPAWVTVVSILVLVYYLTLSFSLMIGMAGFSILCLYLADLLQQLDIAPLWTLSIVIFVVAWISQFCGHYMGGLAVLRILVVEGVEDAPSVAMFCSSGGATTPLKKSRSDSVT